MVTDLLAETKAMFRSMPPPRKEIYEKSDVAVEGEDETILVPQQEEVELWVKEPIAEEKERDKLGRCKYTKEERNIRRMNVLRCLQSGITNSHRIAEKLGLPRGTVVHDIWYWRDNPP